ncbi:MAG: BMP family ABC transporter substrate-binding protein [Myxococcota bacterium]
MTTKARWVGLLFTASVALGGCSGPDGENSSTNSSSSGGNNTPTKVGFLYVGPITDYGWTKAHEDGRLYLENFGSNVTTVYEENVTPDTAAGIIDSMAADGAKVIFTTSFDFLQQAMAAPSRHPDLYTFNCAGFKTAHHFGSYQARVEEMEYLTGMVAGRMTQSNKIGVVAALRIYEQMVHINAFALGVRAVNPDAEVLVRWMGWWFDPEREATGTNELIDEGVDVIKGLTDTNIPLATARDRGVYSIGHDSKDGCSIAPEKCLVTSYYNWGPLYVKLVDEVVNGTYPEGGRSDYPSVADLDVIGLSPYATVVPESVRTEVDAKKADIIARRFNVFQGPFNHDDGTTWVASGEVLSDQDLLCTNRYVAGVRDFHGPDCGADAECGANMTCVAGKCTAPDYSGCTP